MQENNENAKTNKTIYKTKNYVPRTNPIGRPHGLSKPQERKKVKYRVEYDGKIYFATSLNEISLFFGVPHYKVYMINKRSMGYKGNKFSVDYLTQYMNVQIYDIQPSIATYKRGILTDEYVHVDDLKLTIKFVDPIVEEIKQNREREIMINIINSMIEFYDDKYKKVNNVNNKMINTFKGYLEYQQLKLDDEGALNNMKEGTPERNEYLDYLEWKGKAQYK